MTDAQSAAGDAQSALAGRLRAAGCVFAEEEAAILLDAARDWGELSEMTARRCAGEPLEHVVGTVRFGAVDLRVGPGVFIPRQRSLLLAEAARDAVRNRASSRPAHGRAGASDAQLCDPPVVVEAYCGVAPIAASVADRVAGTRIHVVDVDVTALEYARRNLPASARIHRGDGLSALPDELRGRVDVIAAVPPYVPDGAVELLPHETEHEPQAALLAGAEGLDHIRRLALEAGDWLADGGVLLMEMNAAQAEQLLAETSDVWDGAHSVAGADEQTAVVRLVRRHRAAGVGCRA